MKDEPPAKRRIRLGKLWWWMVAVFVGVIGWQMWSIHKYNNAVREAKEAGFRWKCDDALSLIRQDWRNALKKETWGENVRMLSMGKVSDLSRYREMLQRLRPTELSASYILDEDLAALTDLTSLQTLSLRSCWALQNVSRIKGLNALQELRLFDCPELLNVDGVKDLTGLKSLSLNYCRELENLGFLKGLISLKSLSLSGCPSLQNVDVLKGLANLQTLGLSGCPVLQNLNGLKGLVGLQSLDLSGCPALKDMDALKGLTNLQTLYIYNCDKISAAALDELNTALPNLKINPPGIPEL